MATAITLKDLATRDLQRVEGVLNADQLARVGGRGVANRLQDHFQDLEQNRPNKKGWRRQHHWAGARKSIHTQYGTGKVTVIITKPGIALLFFGGVVRPLIKRMLTIPAVEAAYGKRAGEWSDLVLDRRVNPETGKLQLCLVQAEQSPVILGPRSKKTGLRRFKRKESAGGKVIYWLTRQARFQPDPTVLPTERQLEQAAGSAIESTVQRIEQRRGGVV